MHNSNNRTDTGPGSRPYRPARPTQTLTFQIRDRHRDRNQSTGISQPRNNTSTSSPPTATLLLHNRPWCGLRSRLGVVQLLTSGSVSTRLVNSALFLALLSSTAAVACASPVVVCVHAAAAGSCLPPRLRGWWLLPPLPALTTGSTSSAPEILGAAGVRDRGLLRSRPPPLPTGYTCCSLLVSGCSSPPLSPPSPGLTRGQRGGVRIGGLGLLFSAILTAVPGPGPGAAAGGANGWAWTALLRRSRRRPRAWPGGGGGGGLLDLGCSSPPPLSLPSPGLALGRWRGGRIAGSGLIFSVTLAAVPGPGPGTAAGRADCWTWTVLLRHSRRRPRAWPGGGGGGGGLLDLDCSSPPLSLPSPGLARGRPRGGRTAGLGLLFSATLAAVPGPGPGAAAGRADCWTWTALLRRSRRAWPGGGGGGGLLDFDCSSPPPLSPPSPGLGRGGRREGQIAGSGLLFSSSLAAVPGPGPGVAGGGRAAGSRHRRTLTHTTSTPHTHTPPSPPLPPSFCTFITIPPAAIVKPQEFLVRCVSHQGATGVHIHLTLSHASHRPTNLFDSPPAERDTCCLSQRTQESPSEPPRWSARPSLPPAASSRCWSLSGVSLDTTTGVPPRCRRRGGRGPSDCTTTPPPHPTPPHPHPTNPTPPHTAHTHMHSPYHDPWPPPPMRGQAPLDRGTPLPHLIP
jgi:hypothetical protein